MKKVIVNNADLRTAIKLIRNVVDKNALLSVLQNVKCSVGTDGQMTMVSSDMETTIVTKVACQNGEMEPFEFLFPFNIIESASTLNKDMPLEICIGEKSSYIKGDNDKYEVGAAEPIDSFPKVPSFEDSEIDITIESQEFNKALQSALATTSRDTLRPAMTKVLIDVKETTINVVSTNAHCLFKHKFDQVTNSTVELLVGDKMIKGVAGFETINIKYNGNQTCFSNETTSVITKSVDARYPMYESVIPVNEPNIDLGHQEFKNALMKSMVALDDKTCEAVLDLKRKPGSVFVSVNNLNTNLSSEVELPSNYTGDVEKIKFNARLMLTMLGQIPYENIRLSIQSPTRAILLSSEENTDYLGLIMPLM